MQATFDSNGYIEIDGHIFEDPVEARKYVILGNGHVWDPALVVDGVDGNEYQDFDTTARLSVRTELFGGEHLTYNVGPVVETINHVVCPEFPSYDMPRIGNVGAFFG